MLCRRNTRPAYRNSVQGNYDVLGQQESAGGLCRRGCTTDDLLTETTGSPPVAQRDALALTVMRELPAQYPRYGYRRIRVFLARPGHVMSTDRAHRLWRLHKLQVPRQRPWAKSGPLTSCSMPVLRSGQGHVRRFFASELLRIAYQSAH